MVLSPSRNSRSNFRADEEWLENLAEALKSSTKDSKEGQGGLPAAADTVLQTSDLPNRPHRPQPVGGKSGSAAELTRCGSGEVAPRDDDKVPVISATQGNNINKTFLRADQDGNHKIDILELPSESQPNPPDAAAPAAPPAAAACPRSSDFDKADDGAGEISSVDKPDVKEPQTCSSENSEDFSRKDSSGDWSDGVNRRKERVVPEETLHDVVDGEEMTDLAPLPFSGPISAVAYSGPMFSSGGSISRRSDGSSTSTRSFAFPILPFEWNMSPARMPPPDRRWRRRRNWCKSWCKSCCLCCTQPSTHP